MDTDELKIGLGICFGSIRLSLELRRLGLLFVRLFLLSTLLLRLLLSFVLLDTGGGALLFLFVVK